MKKVKKYYYLFVIIGLILLDQLLKIYIPKECILIDGVLKRQY